MKTEDLVKLGSLLLFISFVSQLSITELVIAIVHHCLQPSLALSHKKERIQHYMLPNVLQENI